MAGGLDMNTRTFVNALTPLILVGLLLGCSAGENTTGQVVVASPAARVDYHCKPGVLLTAVYNIEDDLSSYIVHNWDYLERSEGAPRELYSEEINTVTRENGEVTDTDSAITIYFDEFHKVDYVRVNGKAYVRHNEGAWESIPDHDWSIGFDGLMGDSPQGFYNSLYYTTWAVDNWENGTPVFTPGKPYCETTQVDFKGQTAWRYTFHNVPQGLFQIGFEEHRSGAGGYHEVQDKLIQNGWSFQSADYSATVIDLTSSPRLVAESLREKIGDGSGNNLYVTWETEWSNFNEPVTIRRPQQ